MKNNSGKKISFLLMSFFLFPGLFFGFQVLGAPEGTQFYADGVSTDSGKTYLDYDLFSEFDFPETYPCWQYGTQYLIYIQIFNDENTSVDIGSFYIDTTWGSGYNQKSYHYQIKEIWPADNYYFQLKCGESPNWQEPIAYFNFSYDGLAYEVETEATDGVCGISDGGTFVSGSALDTGFCDVGDFSGLLFGINPDPGCSTGKGWTWSCDSTGETAFCNACYDPDAENVNPACGYYDGQTYSVLGLDPDGFCSSGYETEELEFLQGWTWNCRGDNLTGVVGCSALKTGYTEIPDLSGGEDCSQLTLPNKWFCEINNTLKGIFLPSTAKISELKNVFSDFDEKAPICYIKQAEIEIKAINERKDEATEIEIKNVTIDRDFFQGKVGDFLDYARAIAGFVIVLIFIVWAFNYIKRIFK